MLFRNLVSEKDKFENPNLTVGDWTFGKGKNNYVKENAALGLNIRTRIQSWLNDCFFNTKAGIDWTNRIGSKNQRALLEADIRRQILQATGVTGILEFSTELDGRNFTANYTITTIYSKSFRDSVKLGVFNA